MGLTDLEYRLLCISDRWSMTLKVEKVKLILCLCALSLSSKGNPDTSYIDRTQIKNLGHVVPLIRFSLHCTVHIIGQGLITRSTPFVIHFVMMPNQLSDVGLTDWSIYCKGHLHGIRLTHNNKKNPCTLLYIVPWLIFLLYRVSSWVETIMVVKVLIQKRSYTWSRLMATTTMS